MSLPPDFTASTFLYLNPEVSAFSNVTTVEDAYARYPTEFSNLPYELPEPALQGPFSADVYIAQYRGVIDISHLNHVIELAVSNVEGAEARTDGKFVANFFRRVFLESENVFRLATAEENRALAAPGTESVPTDHVPCGCGNDALNAENLVITDSNLRVGDAVKILKNAGHELVYGTVADVLDARTFRVSVAGSNASGAVDSVTDSNADYVLYGIQVSDAERIAHINYTRRYLEGYSNEAPTHALEPFNTELYQTLYPDARLLTEEEAFVSARNNWVTNDCRITKAADLLNTSAPVLHDLCVLCNLYVPGDVFFGGGGDSAVQITDVSRDSVTPSSGVGSNTLITEKAIKKYVERPYETTATFNDVQVQGDLSVDGTIDASAAGVVAGDVAADSLTVGSNSNLYADADEFRLDASDARFACNLQCKRGTARVFHAGRRFAVGGGDDLLDVGSNPLWDARDHDVTNIVVNDTLTLGNAWTVRENAPDAVLTARHAAQTASQTDALSLRWDKTSSNANPARLEVGGDIIARGTVLSVSDAGQKKNAAPICDAVRRIEALRGYTFEHDGRRAAGVMAQEVERVLPEAVLRTGAAADDAGREATLKCVAYGNLCALLIEGVRELGERVRVLEGERAHMHA